MKNRFTVCHYYGHEVQEAIAHLLNGRYGVPAIATPSGLLVDEAAFDSLDWSTLNPAMQEFREWLNGQIIAKVVERDFPDMGRYVLRAWYPNINGTMDLIVSHSLDYLEYKALYMVPMNGWLEILDTQTGRILETMD